jgi:hypothetical protein
MEKEFIPYELAVKLKALGFNEPCFGKYLSNLQSDWKEFELILEMGMNEEFEDNRNIYLLEEACSAPTYSQAFRWFREKHGLDYEIPYAGNKGEYHAFVEKYVYGNNRNNPSVFTYEGAEEICLEKLIEIVENEKTL